MMTCDLPNLLPHHVRELVDGSGLSVETIREAGLYTESNFATLAHTINWKKYPKRMGAALVIPYRTVDGELNGYKRLKPDNPRRVKTRDGEEKPVKYESPKGLPNRVYLPAGVIPHLKDSAAELLLTEGEKKALAATQNGFPCVGLVGVFGFVKRGSGQLPDELEYVDWKGRRVYIAFDSDIAENSDVQRAASRIAAFLQARGAVVKVLRLPAGPNGEKTGLDDFLVRHGRVELRKLLDHAEDADTEGPADKLPATAVDPAESARRFLKVYATHEGERTLRFHRDAFSAWNGKRYVEMPESDTRCRVYQYLDPAYFKLTRSVVSNVMEGLKAETIVAWHVSPPCWLGKDGGPPHCITMQNGILDLDRAIAGDEDCLLPHSPRWFSPVCLPYPFDHAATCPTWLKVIERNLDADPERIAIIQEFVGWCLRHDLSHQRFLLMYGEGANGKSVVCAAMTAILGKENVSAVPLEMFGQRFQLNATLGKLANIAAEIGEIDKAAEGILKSFTSGDTIQFERKHKDPFDAHPTAKLVLATNNLPRFTDKSGGLWRRMILMPFDVTIPQEERIVGMDKPEWWLDRGELPGMFLWAMEGLRRLRAQGRFTTSAVCEAMQADYRRESNPARLFLTENYREAVCGEIVTEDVYQKYSAWCSTMNYRPLAGNTFGKEITRAFPSATGAWVHDFEGNRRKGYRGICHGSAEGL